MTPDNRLQVAVLNAADPGNLSCWLRELALFESVGARRELAIQVH